MLLTLYLLLFKQITALRDSICFSDSGQINLNVISSTTPVKTISWSPHGSNYAFKISPANNTRYAVTVTDSMQCFAQDSIYITVVGTSKLSADAGRDTLICAVQNAILGGNPTASGGVGNYSYLWSPTSSTVANPAVTTTANTTYYVTVNSSICSAIDSVKISVNVLPKIAMGSSQTQICYGDSVVVYSRIISGNKPYTYLWNNSKTDSSFTTKPLATSTYFVTVTDVNNCTIADNINMVVNPLPSSNAGPDKTRVSCAGDSAQIGGNSAINEVYNWTPNYAIDNINKANPWTKPLVTTTYYLTVTNTVTGCKAYDTVIVTASNSILTASKTVRNLNCYKDSSGEITIQTANGYVPYLYKTSKTSLQASNWIIKLSAGIDSFTVVDSKGCTITDTFILSEPPDIKIDSIFKKNLRCYTTPEGELQIKASGGSPPYRYRWDRSNSLDSFALNLLAGQHIVTVEDKNQCLKSQQMSLTQPDSLIVLDSIVGNKCAGDSNAEIIVNAYHANPPYTYLWSTGSKINRIDRLREGTYKLTVTDNNNCIYKYQYAITDLAKLKLEIQRKNYNCDESQLGELLLSASGGKQPYFYSIDSGRKFSYQFHFQHLYSGKYYVALKDKNDCHTSDTTRIHSGAVIDFEISPKDTTIDLGEQVQLSYRVTQGDSTKIQERIWTPNVMLSCVDCDSPIARPYSPQVYTLALKYNDNCITTREMTIQINSNEELFIPSAFTPDIPNSENSEVKIYSKNILTARLIIVNRWGEKLFESNNAHLIGWDGRYKGELMPIDVYSYYAEVTYLNKRIVTKKGSVTLLR
jgi:gliding motility-associated-like protein